MPAFAQPDKVLARVSFGVWTFMNASQKIAQYLGEAKAGEDALVRVLQSQIAMTPLDVMRGSGGEEQLANTLAGVPA
jgi:hypothetical protein